MSPIFRCLLLISIAVMVPIGVLPSCTKSAEQAARYHCPMHPTYVSDRPGDCPICGMRLVPIDEKKSTKTTSTTQAAPVKTEVAHAESTSHVPTGPVIWTCPMDPEVVSDKPGRCQKCGMALVEKAVTQPEAGVPASAVPGLAPIDVSAEGLRLAGVRTAVAEQGTITRTIRAVGVVRADETRVRHVHTKFSGWVEKLYVNATGEVVTRGRPILSIYSQELLAAQNEYLQSKNGASSLQKSEFAVVREGAGDLVAAARRRLELLDMPKTQIDELERTGVVNRAVVLSAPVSGVVMSKSVFEGQQVDPGTELFTVTDLSRVWLEGDIYESESSAVQSGQEVRITFVSEPAKVVNAKVNYVYPYLNAETRTLRLRIVLPNPDHKLKLESYANLEIPVETADGAVVPDSAILDTGVRQVVFVNTDGGRFEPRIVRVGIRANGRAQIVSGVKPGERVVVKANFLLDSESRLRAALLSPLAEPAANAAVGTSVSHAEPHP